MNSIALQYRSALHSYTMAAQQVLITEFVARHALEDYPENLPDSLKLAIEGEVQELEEWSSNGGESEFPVPTVSSMVELVRSLGRNFYGDDYEVDFDELLRGQALVQLVACGEAFLADTLRAICLGDKTLLADKKKTLTWEQVVELGGWDEIVSHLQEQFVVDFSGSTLTTRLSTIEKRLGFRPGLEGAPLGWLRLLISKRNKYVHNGGRADVEFCTKHPGICTVGELIEVSETDLAFLASLPMTMGVVLFKQVCDSYFGGVPTSPFSST